MIKYQQTINKEVKLEGVGLHTGAAVTMIFCPAPPKHGIKFHRVDIGEDAIINADCDLVTEVARGTTLEKDNIKVATVDTFRRWH